MGEQLTLKVVAESADGWNTFFLPPEEYQAKVDILAGHCRDVGRDPAEIEEMARELATLAEARLN